MEHVMVDIETLGTTPDAAIIAIGACEFNPEIGKIGRKFRHNVDWDSGMSGRSVDAGTLKWWVTRGENAQAEILIPGAQLAHVLMDLWGWMDPAESDCKVWGNGATFDITILENAFRQYDINPPWKYQNIRDVRTLADVAAPFVKKEAVPFQGIKHDPLCDAVHQATYVSKMWQALRGH